MPSREEMENAADDLGLTGRERAVFLGDVTPRPVAPKAAPAPVKAPVAAPAPKAVNPFDAPPKAPTAPAKAVQPVRPDVAFDPLPVDAVGGTPVAPIAVDEMVGPPFLAARGPREAAGKAPLPSPMVAGFAKPEAERRVQSGAGYDPGTKLREMADDAAGFLGVMDRVEAQRAKDAAEMPAAQAWLLENGYTREDIDAELAKPNGGQVVLTAYRNLSGAR